MRVPFIAGIKRVDRLRGAGWLDCPQCHEHALQDVVDDMRFATILFYRLAPVQRTRSLICRRCGFRRRAEPEEIGRLDTAGSRIGRAVMAPVGLISIAVLGALLAVAAGGAAAGGGSQLSFIPASGQPVAPLSLERPGSWNFETNGDSTPPNLTIADGNSAGEVVISRLTDSATLSQVIDQHFADQSGLNATCFPTAPPPATATKLAGVAAEKVTIRYNAPGGGTAVLVLYALLHKGVGYTVAFITLTPDELPTMQEVEKHVTDTLKFTGEEPSPSAGASASPSLAPSPSPASPSPAPTATESPGALPAECAKLNPTASPRPATTPPGVPGSASTSTP